MKKNIIGQFSVFKILNKKEYKRGYGNTAE
jgi:hypothetical protein